MFLADESFPEATVEALRGIGHDVKWVRFENPGASPADILNLAEREGRVLLTVDEGYSEAAANRQPSLRQSGVIIFQLQPITPLLLTPAAVETLNSGRDWHGHISTVTSGGVEMIPSVRPTL